MNLNYFFSLYWRNIKGTFINGFVEPVAYIAPLIWLGHIALLPLTLTIGAGIKTFIDFFARKSQPEERINAKKVEINDLNSEQIEELREKISHYNPHSNSSKMLLSQLSRLASDERLLVVEEYRVEKQRLILDQLGPNAEQVYRKEYIATIKLDEAHQKLLKKYDSKNKEHLAGQKLKAQKGIICGYLSDEKNNGKKLMQILLGLFSPKTTGKFEDDMLQESSEVKLNPLAHTN